MVVLKSITIQINIFLQFNQNIKHTIIYNIKKLE